MNGRAFVAAAVAGIAAPAVSAQQRVWQLDDRIRREQFGAAYLLDDVDGDGVPDLVAPAWGIEAGEPDALRLLSGADLSLLWEVTSASSPEIRFHQLARAGDLDGDGIVDFAGVGDYDHVALHSGRDGSEIGRYAKGGLDTNTVVRELADIDGDGDVELLFASPYEPKGGTSAVGAVRAVTARTGAILYRVTGTALHSAMGRAGLATIGDLDGDAIPDFAAQDEHGAGNYPSIRIFSGADGAELLAIPLDHGDYVYYYFTSIAAVGDQDGDGIPDVAALGDRSGVSAANVAILFSGSDGHELHRLVGEVDGYSRELAVAGDHDGDGIPELAFSTRRDWSGPAGKTWFRLHRGGDGAELNEIVGDSLDPETTGDGGIRVADVDFDGDGACDLVVGAWERTLHGWTSGAVDVHDWSSGARMATRPGDVVHETQSGPSAFAGDHDSDGLADVFVVDGNGPRVGEEAVRLLSGADGSLLVEHLLGGWADGDLAALPDVDGDGRDDFAIGLDSATTAARVEIRAANDGRLLVAIAPATPTASFGAKLAFGVQPASQALQIAIAAPLSGTGIAGGGEVAVHDVATGARLFSVVGAVGGEALGSSIAYVGDMDGDGTGDWIAGAPFHEGTFGPVDTGRALLFSGVDGSKLHEFFGSVANARLGRLVAALGDQDGDGVGELMFTGDDWYGSSPGSTSLVAGGSYALLQRHPGRVLGELRGLGDVDQDGRADWARTDFDRLVVQSGATGARLLDVDLTPGSYDGLQMRLSAPPSRPAPTADGDAIPDLLVSSGALQLEGSALLLALDAIMLGVDPAVAYRNQRVVATIAGGPAGNPVLLELATVNGVPLGVVIDQDFFDATGVWWKAGIVPSGMKGIEWGLRAWAIDRSGRVVATPEQLLEFQ